MQLGNTVHEALARIGITPDRVARWVGKPCGCPERQERLNQLGRWASRVLGGKANKSKQYLEDMLR